MVTLEQTLPTEEADTAEIVRGILAVQIRYAAEQHRKLLRGTHTKGICARAELEVFDVARTIGDRALAERLAHGIWAAPGFYPALVRFANASSTLKPDTKPDLRAMSFSIELPRGFSSNTTRQDYTLQNARTFPINDAHVFALLMRVLGADGGAAQVKAFRSLSWRERGRVLRAIGLGVWQGRGRPRPYQQHRYWSTVPFRHGPFDAAKYSAIPAASNPAHALSSGPDALQDELVRHLNDDREMSAFDIGVQLLDAERMTRWGKHHHANFWIENSSIEWNETQAPFHIVGRLTLVAKSQLDAAAGERSYIDVNEHATLDCQPIGSLNRVRRAAELASREARLGVMSAEEIPPAPTPPPSPPPRRPRSRGLLKRAAILVVAFVLLYAAAAALYAWKSGGNIPAAERVDQVRYLDQGWGPERASADREAYYYTGQGTTMQGIRYGWFVNLERPFHSTRLADPDHLRALNFIVDPAPTHANPDQLPLGFARRYDDTVNDYVVDITCSACHSGQLNVTRNGTTTAIRIDGGQALHAFTDMKAGNFQMEVALGVAETFLNPMKFNRFAGRVLGDGNTLKAKWRLWRDLATTLQAIKASGFGSFSPKFYPVQEGFGRTDALARISNVVFGDHVDAANYRAGSAPVSFPYLWNIWKFDWVQYGASVSQPMARNVGEAMGVGATYHLVDDYERPIAAGQRYRTSISFDNILRIESTLQTLTPPRWPEDLLGVIDQGAAARGKVLFEEHCVQCHGPWVSSDAYKLATSPERLRTDPMWVIRTKNVKDVGTDPTAAKNFFNNRVDLTPTGLTMDEVRPLLKREYDTQKMRQTSLAPAIQQELDRRRAAGADANTLSEIEAELKEATEYRLTDERIARTLDAIDLKSVNVGVGLNILGMIIRERYYTDRHFSPEARACFEGFGTLDLPQVVDAYKPRPLEGVWATPPFLHNGSVPNIYQLLSPASERSKRFFIGRREFDPVKVGYVTEPLPSSGGFWFDTSQAGNLNTGHEFAAGYKPYDENNPVPAGGIIGPALTPQQRMDVIEYLKIHRDEPNGAPRRVPPDCFALLK